MVAKGKFYKIKHLQIIPLKLNYKRAYIKVQFIKALLQ